MQEALAVGDVPFPGAAGPKASVVLSAAVNGVTLILSLPVLVCAFPLACCRWWHHCSHCCSQWHLSCQRRWVQHPRYFHNWLSSRRRVKQFVLAGAVVQWTQQSSGHSSNIDIVITYSTSVHVNCRTAMQANAKTVWTEVAPLLGAASVTHAFDVVIDRL